MATNPKIKFYNALFSKVKQLYNALFSEVITLIVLPSVGCAPIPDDYTNFWSPKYNEKSMGLNTQGVPVIADADLVSARVV